MAAHELRTDCFDDVREVESCLLLGQPRVVDDLEEQVTELVPELGKIAALDCIGDLVSFFYRVWGDRLEALLEIPRTAALRGAQPCHDLQ